MIALSGITLFNIDLLHMIVSFAIPLIMIVVTIIYLMINSKITSVARSDFQQLEEKIDNLDSFGMNNLPEMCGFFENTSLPGLRRACNRLAADSESQFQNRWLPDLNRYLKYERIFSAPGRNSLSSRPASAILSSGLLGAVVSLLLQQQISPADSDQKIMMIFVPAVVGIAAAALLQAQASAVSKYLQTAVSSLIDSIARRLPVFNEHAGIALLVDQVMQHDFQMEKSVGLLNDTVSRLAESEMADGIKSSVEQVLMETVAPSIKQSSDTLSALAGDLTNRQEQGMRELSEHFADALANDLHRYLGPVNQELTRMTSLMADVKNYIDYAMKALETTRQQNEQVIHDANVAMQTIAQSREDLSDDFAVFSEQLRLLALTSERLTAQQSGHETTLAAILDELGGKLDKHSGQLGNSLEESARAAAIAEDLSARQQESARAVMELLTRQNNELIQTSEQLHTQIDHFTSSSEKYVDQTLQNFDHGLAELVERMSYTVSEIRDAVDALPGALRQNPDYGS
jgi:ABC-type transporter Mla subunit MlaD